MGAQLFKLGQFKFTKNVQRSTTQKVIKIQKIKTAYVGLINIYKYLFVFCKIKNIFWDIAKIRFLSIVIFSNIAYYILINIYLQKQKM